MSSSRSKDVLIVGAGGHGAVVLDILRAANLYHPVGFIDADPSLVGQSIESVPVLGPLNQLPRLRQRYQLAIIAIGDNRVRLSYAHRLTAAGFELINAIHPSAVVSSTARLGRNIVAAAGVIVGTGVKIADSVLLNTGCLVDHECEIGESAHIGPGVKLAGRVQVEPGAFIGIGACVIPCLRIGSEAIIGAGAVVIHDVEPRITVTGVPARPLAHKPLAVAS